MKIQIYLQQNINLYRQANITTHAFINAPEIDAESIKIKRIS